jgi:phage I-like protein
MDAFVPAIEELAEAILSDEDIEQALQEIAEEHGLAAQALRNRAIRALGPLEEYKTHQAEQKRAEQRAAMRRDPVLAGASFVAAVSSLSPKLKEEERQAAIQRLAEEYGVDPAEHRDAISRLRRR